MGPSRREKSTAILALLILIVLGLIMAGATTGSLIHKFNHHQTVARKLQQKASSLSQNSPSVTIHSDRPRPEQLDLVQSKLQSQLPDLESNHHGAFIVNHNQPTITVKNNAHLYAANQTDNHGRAWLGNAVLDHSSRQYQNRETTNNGRTTWTPLGWHQLTNLPGRYHYAYNRGHLLGYALVGNVKGFNASESNAKNIVTQTSWANQANLPLDTGQNYYEGLVRKALDQNKKVRYQVRAWYASDHDQVPIAIQLQALSTDNSLKFNVLIPNVQGNININYETGVATPYQS